MIANPELRRNLWLEATPARLVLIPAILCGVFFLTFVSEDHRLGPATAVAAAVAFCLLAWAWGAHLSSESILSELRGRTWDWQRMSGLGGWALTWGKLAGATFPAWYGGAICLLVYAASDPGEERQGWVAAFLVLTGVLLQATTFFGALHAASRRRVVARAQSTVLVVLGTVVLIQFVWGASGSTRVVWYGRSPSGLALATLSVGAFAAFAVIGAWVRVRRELRIRTLALAWPAFLLFVMVWAAGFVNTGDGRVGARALVAFLVAVAATWGTALVEPKDPVELRRLARAAREGRWRGLAEDLPAWALGLPFVVAAWLAVAASPAMAIDRTGDVRVLTVSIALFLLRDLAIVLYLGLGERPRRADLLAVVLFATGYVLVPLVLSASGLRALASAFYPDPARDLLSAGSALIQAGLAVALLVERWRTRAHAVGAERVG